MAKVLLSLFDYTGNWSRPYIENGWEVIQIDIKRGSDVMDFDPAEWMAKRLHTVQKYTLPEIGILAAVPCTDYALSGARHFAAKDMDGRTARSQELVEKTRQIIEWFKKSGSLQFWAIENPMSRIHSLNHWMGKPKLKFNPCDYALYDPNPEQSAYNKATWLWGEFNDPEQMALPAMHKENPGWAKLGGKSERTKELRSITPMGFAYAFYQANH
jgi:hypothetical protein